MYPFFEAIHVSNNILFFFLVPFTIYFTENFQVTLIICTIAIMVLNSFFLSWGSKLYVFKRLLKYLTAAKLCVIGWQALKGIMQFVVVGFLYIENLVTV